MNKLDQKLSYLFYPSEFSRRQRSIRNFARYKANELRNLLFYGAMIFKDFLSKKYFEHFLLYVIFIRVLCQENITKDDILSSYSLIKSFNVNFKDYYGSINQTFNLHGHLHLPKQVLNYGPLNKISAFPFEGFFKICKGLLHGTRDISNEIITKIEIQSYLFFENHNNLESMKDQSLKIFLEDKIFGKKKKNQNSNKTPVKYSSQFENSLNKFIEENFTDILNQIEISLCIRLNSISLLIFT